MLKEAHTKSVQAQTRINFYVEMGAGQEISPLVLEL